MYHAAHDATSGRPARCPRGGASRPLEAGAAQWEAERPENELHTPGTGRHINAIVSSPKGLRRLLDDKPGLALRVLTDPRGRVQNRLQQALVQSSLTMA